MFHFLNYERLRGTLRIYSVEVTDHLNLKIASGACPSPNSLSKPLQTETNFRTNIVREALGLFWQVGSSLFERGIKSTCVWQVRGEISINKQQCTSKGMRVLWGVCGGCEPSAFILYILAARRSLPSICNQGSRLQKSRNGIGFSLPPRILPCYIYIT